MWCRALGIALGIWAALALAVAPAWAGGKGRKPRSVEANRSDDASRASNAARVRSRQGAPKRRAGTPSGSQNALGNTRSPRLRSEIGRSRKLVHYARAIEGTVQAEVDHLTDMLARGHENPGIGSHPLSGLSHIRELRGRKGGRVYYYMQGGTPVIVAKSTKRTQKKVIEILHDLYKR